MAGWSIPSTRNLRWTCFSLASMWTSLARCSRAFSRMVSTRRMVGLASAWLRVDGDDPVLVVRLRQLEILADGVQHPLGRVHAAQPLQQGRAGDHHQIHWAAVRLHEVVFEEDVAGVGDGDDQAGVVATEWQEQIAPHPLQREGVQNSRFQRGGRQVDDRQVVESAEGLGQLVLGEEAGFHQMPAQTAAQPVSLAQGLVHLRAGDVAFADKRFFQRPVLCHFFL